LLEFTIAHVYLKRNIMETPSLDLNSFTIIDQVDKGIIRDEVTGCEFVIGALDILFLRCIDGNRSVVTIRQELAELLDYDLPMEDLWKAFDRLSDIGVLSNRLCPPAGGQQTSRRRFLSKLTAFTATASVLASNLATAQSSSEQTVKIQAEQNQKQQARQAEQNQKQQAQQAEQDQKNPGSPSEQANKSQAEQDQKNSGSSSEQDTKSQAEQNQKQQSEQNQKQQSEQSQKQQAEQDQKNPGSSSEQNTKAQAEQNQKQQAEQSQKQQAEQSAKQNSESQQKSSQNELSNKEMQIKNQSGNNPPASVSEPTAIAILGLGLAGLAFRKQRMNKIAKEELRLTEAEPDQNEAEAEGT